MTIRTTDADGKEEAVSEYICDWPDCPNVAERIVGALNAAGAPSAVCGAHAAMIATKPAE